ncbi:DUF2461 domain-containing protein [Flagellimonas okinawensis]|uniref:DUF2461 domain-containing protein n=1 Tax=Flagellimonas okinawensis TaxID=3031324 RepID=A0ABT5XIM0_9FLAO|nr:DUF2461 domain-containing protein [[Muricauda] okinawensis]MDF0705665.1 DUF2461 domain-containing protein [[Muricauda] okinawensis]
MASNVAISKEVFEFLTALKNNNNKEWFEENKATFKKHQGEIKNFLEAAKDHLNHHDDIEKMKLFRIYRDVRFSKDKTPYKAHFAGFFSRLGAHLRGGYYIHIKPGESFLGAGFWAPNKEDLFRIRKELEMDAEEFREVINQKSLKTIWGELQGDEVKTAPKGFDKEHPDIDLIRKKQFVFMRPLTDAEVLSPTFLEEVDNSYRAIRPYFDLMSEILTTNLNGESILE